MFDDDELAGLMRRSDPARTPENAPLSLRAEMDLARITAAAKPIASHLPSRRRSRGWRWVTIPALGAALAVVLVFGQMLVPANGPDSADVAQAAGLPLLVATGPAEPLADAVEQVLASPPMNPMNAPTHRSSYAAWYLNTDFAADGTAHPYVVAQEVKSTSNPDLSGELVITAGHPQPLTGTSGENNVEQVKPGTVLQHDLFKSGEMGILFPEVPPEDGRALLRYALAGAGTPDSSDPVLVLDAITLLLDEWSLTRRQEASLLGAVSGLNGFTSLGTVTDRLDRPGLAFSARSPNEDRYESMLIIDPVTGKILSIEKIQILYSEKEFSTPAVTNSTAWK